MSAWSPQAHPPPPPEQVEAALRPALPTVERRYHDFYRTPRNAWWKPLAVLAFGLAWFVVISVIGLVGMALDGTLSRSLDAAQSGQDPASVVVMTPTLFLANNVGLALAIPTAMLAQWAVWGQRPRWLSSVAGGFRWRWFARCLAWALPPLLALVTIEYLIEPATDVRWRDYTVLMIVGILVTTPFQAAGEEYLLRGLLQRATASWFRNATVGWVASTVVGSLVFMGLHLAQDPWLNVFYFAFGVLASWIAWRTGGLEASVALHVVNNMVAEALMPFTDFSGMLDRSAGQGSPVLLVHLAVLAMVVALLAWQARRRQVVVASAPGAVRSWNPLS